MRCLVKIISAAVIFSIVFSFISFKALAAQASNGRDIVKFTGDIYVNSENIVSGDVVSINGNIFIEGEVTGDVVSIFGDIIINGKVTGDAISVFGSITVGDHGDVMGDTVEALGGMLGDFRINSNLWSNIPAAQVNRWFYPVISLMLTMGLLAISSLCYIIAPQKINRLSHELEINLIKKMGIGFVTLIVFPLAGVLLTVLLAITVIGAIIIPFLWLGIAGVFIGSVAAVYIYIGRKISALTSSLHIHPYAALIVGLFSIWLIKLSFSLGGSMFAWVNPLITAAIVLAGVGALTEHFLLRKRRAN